MSIRLKSIYKKRIKEDQGLQLKIAQKFFKKNIVTVQRWVKANHPALVSDIVQDIIRETEGLAKDVELVEEVPEGEEVKSL